MCSNINVIEYKVFNRKLTRPDRTAQLHALQCPLPRTASSLHRALTETSSPDADLLPFNHPTNPTTSRSRAADIASRQNPVNNHLTAHRLPQILMRQPGHETLVPLASSSSSTSLPLVSSRPLPIYTHTTPALSSVLTPLTQLCS